MATLDRARVSGRGIERHGHLVEALITLGALVQGLADRAFAAAGIDRPDPDVDALMADLTLLARAVIVSWDSGFVAEGPLPVLDRRVPDASLTLKLPEGYAFYALYPEAIAAAARQLVLEAPPRVIGIRSIGTSLAAMAAAALGAPDPVTVRPSGHPFARTVTLDDARAARLLEGAAHYVIVDEGPGLSGSSFAAVATWLEAEGVPPSRIAFLPSHPGEPGGEASPATRARWAATQRPVVPFDALIGPERLARWLRPLIGRLDAPLQDLSGGRWRALRFRSGHAWPAVQPGTERLKYLAEAGGRRWLVRFAGLGDQGERKLARARILAAAGWVPPPAGLVHGFLVEPWIEGEPLRAGDGDTAAAVGRYLSDRARLLPPPESPGADPAALAEMARVNLREAFGAERAARLEPHLAPPADIRPVAIDGRLDRHEWLAGGHGLLKADALDHDRAHDLVGAQDIAWDVAGAIVELDLGAEAQERLLAALHEAGIGPSLPLNFWLLTYVAFRIGRAQMAADGLRNWPEEAARNTRLVASYCDRIAGIFSL